MQFDINKYKDIIKHIDEEEEEDMELVVWEKTDEKKSAKKIGNEENLA